MYLIDSTNIFINNDIKIIIENLYEIIDAVLEDAFGFTAFMSLLSGIMTFSEDSSVSGGYKVDFWSHSDMLQIELLRNFVGRNLHGNQAGVLPDTFFKTTRRHEYFASMFLFGSKRGNRRITTHSSYFLDWYYKRHILSSVGDYKRATDLFIQRSFSEYLESVRPLTSYPLGFFKDVPKLNEMSLKGRLEIYDFLVKKLVPIHMGPLSFLPQSGKDIFLNKLMERVMYPQSKSDDIVTTLRNILFTGSDGNIRLDGQVSLGGKTTKFTIVLEVTYEELMENITPDQLFTMNFYYGGANFNYRYYLDFDLIWRDLASKVESAYNLINDKLEKAPIAEDEKLKVDFYQKTIEGLKLVTEKRFSSLSTKFSKSEFSIDPNNQGDLETKVLSMVLWIVMEPNIVPVVRLPNKDTYLVLDLFRILDEDEFSSVLTGSYSPPSGLKQFQEQYLEIFSYSDVKNFLNFHNHKLSDTHTDMISYVMDKFIRFYAKFLGGNLQSKLSDLR